MANTSKLIATVLISSAARWGPSVYVRSIRLDRLIATSSFRRSDVSCCNEIDTGVPHANGQEDKRFGRDKTSGSLGMTGNIYTRICCLSVILLGFVRMEPYK